MSDPTRDNNSSEEPVTFSASGLPEGLLINPSMGLISGTVDLRLDWATGNHSPGRDEDVKPDLLIDPPEQNPNDVQDPPSDTDQ